MWERKGTPEEVAKAKESVTLRLAKNEKRMEEWMRENGHIMEELDRLKNAYLTARDKAKEKVQEYETIRYFYHELKQELMRADAGIIYMTDEEAEEWEVNEAYREYLQNIKAE